MSEVITEVKSKKTKVTKATKATKATEKPDATEKKADTTTKKKTVKTKVDKYNGFKVPDRKIVCTRWTIYIYDMIKEAKLDLLQREDVRNAYNNLVECMRKYDGYIESYIPSKYQKYNTEINIMKTDVKFNYNTFRWIANNSQRDTILENKEEFIKDFKQMYTPLFDLIKRDVINYMELKKHEIGNKYIIERNHYQMGKIEKCIKVFESKIEELYKVLGKLSEEVIKCKQPPKLTVFE
jgi:hypothetical protein